MIAAGPQRVMPTGYVTLGGVPLRFQLQWPFHKSTSGADWNVLHGAVQLLSDPALHADFSANFTQTLTAALPSLAREHAAAVVINAVRVATDAGKLEFLKSGKRLPVEVSSRYLDLKTGQVRFLRADKTEIKSFLRKKLYWLGLRSANPAGRVWIGDPCDAQYLGVESEAVAAAAAALAQEGWCVAEGEFASGSARLEQQSAEFQNELQKTLERSVAIFNAAMQQK